jgi:hypothetical protein
LIFFSFFLYFFLFTKRIAICGRSRCN